MGCPARRECDGLCRRCSGLRSAYCVLLVEVCSNCRGLSFGRSVLLRVVAPLDVGCVVSGGRLIEMQGESLCVFGFCSCVRVGLLVMVPSLVGGAAGGARVVLFCVVCVRSVFPCFWRLDYHLFFATWGFVAVWFGVVVPLVSCSRH